MHGARWMTSVSSDSLLGMTLLHLAIRFMAAAMLLLTAPQAFGGAANDCEYIYDAQFAVKMDGTTVWVSPPKPFRFRSFPVTLITTFDGGMLEAQFRRLSNQKLLVTFIAELGGRRYESLYSIGMDAARPTRLTEEAKDPNANTWFLAIQPTCTLLS
jgi:hypothetical protein